MDLFKIVAQHARAVILSSLENIRPTIMVNVHCTIVTTARKILLRPQTLFCINYKRQLVPLLAH